MVVFAVADQSNQLTRHILNAVTLWPGTTLTFVANDLFHFVAFCRISPFYSAHFSRRFLVAL
jgi:hypothetical protein